MSKTEEQKQKIVQIYRKRAGNYNLTANLYYLFGYREYAYRKKAVEALNLSEGDSVIDLCCGTGLNFSFLQEKIGLEGKIIGVDLTDAMLEKARERVKRNEWDNVELIQSDVAKYKFPKRINAILSTYALALVPEYDEVVQRAYDSLVSEGRFVELGLKIPKNSLARLKSLIYSLIRPFGNPEGYISNKVWESVEDHFDEHELINLYGGISYITIGEKNGSKA